MLRLIWVVLTAIVLSAPVALQAQEASAPETTESPAMGGSSLEDILRRQEGLRTDDPRVPAPDAALVPELATRGGQSDARQWDALRQGSADLRVSAGGEVAKTVIQDGGMRWYQFRAGPLRTWGGWLLAGTLVALLLFYLLRGRVMIDEPMTGRKVTRFKAFERLTHWLLAGTFLILGVTGLLSLFGRVALIPLMGHGANSAILSITKPVHNYLAWPFMLSLIFVLVLWLRHNIPNRLDLTWFAQAGGLFGKNHPPAKKFNAGQKIIFWSVILLGGSIAASGLSLLFPYDLPLFSKTFGLIHGTALGEWISGFTGPLPTHLAPQEEMQLAQLWHAIVAFVLMAIVIAHIYIGSVGMEGAFDAMGSGEVDEAWAHQHHSIWLDEVLAEKAKAEADKD